MTRNVGTHDVEDEMLRAGREGSRMVVISGRVEVNKGGAVETIDLEPVRFHADAPLAVTIGSAVENVVPNAFDLWPRNENNHQGSSPINVMVI
jgi:hypothetical protein